MGHTNRKWILFATAAAIVLLITSIIFLSRDSTEQVNFTEVVADLRAGEIEEIHISSSGAQAELTYADGDSQTMVLPSGDGITALLRDANVPESNWPTIFVAPEQGGLGDGAAFFLRMGFIVVLFIVLIFFFRRMMPGMFGGSRKGGFQPVPPGQSAITFADVAGASEVKSEVSDVIEFLREPEHFHQVGAHIPKGLMLVGPPGTGKTLIARALANEAKANFFSVSGSEFVELYVGVGASRVRDLFKKAKENAPAIVFIDEIDSIGRKRGRADNSSEYDQTLNQILVEMDGFAERTTVVVVAATNRVDILDSALLRPGRFDRKVMVDLPDREARRSIIEVHSRGKPVVESANFDEIAARTSGMTGADLANVVNEAAILAARDRRVLIEMHDYFEALDRTLAGPARTTRRFSEQERRVIAYHEAGHAVVTHLLPYADTVRKVSIVSRGQAGGYTMITPEEDRGLWTRQQLTQRLAGLLGGLAAEEIIFGDITTGSSNDLEQVTSIALSMVQRFGMSSRYGLLSVGGSGTVMSQQTTYTGEQEAQEIVRAAHLTASSLLRQRAADLEKIAQRLLDVETIDYEELQESILPDGIDHVVEPSLPSANDEQVSPGEELSESVPVHRRSRRIGSIAASILRGIRDIGRSAEPGRVRVRSRGPSKMS